MKPFYPSVKRIPRLYYWIAWTLCNLICGTAEWVLMMEYGNGNSPYMLAGLCGVGLFHLLYLALLTVKRFHDAGRSTLYCIVCMLLVPAAAGIGMIFAVAVKESDRDNAWGANEERQQFGRETEYYRR